MPNFHYESKVTCCQIFTMEIWYFARMPQESIDWDHTYSKSEPQNPPHMQSLERQCQNHVLFTANLQKIRFYQNKGLSLDMHCGVPNTFPTRNQTSELKNQDFLPSALDLKKKCIFSQPKIGNKINQKQMTNHTLEKPNDWWRLHLPLVIPLKFGQDSCHTPKGKQIPSSTKRESTRSSARTTQLSRVASNGPYAHGSVAPLPVLMV